MNRARRRATPREYLFLALFTLGMLWFAYLTWGIFWKEERARTAVTDTHAQLSSIDSREATLQSDLDNLNTSRGKETALRETLGVAKPGEEVIIVVPPASSSATTTPLTWWQELLSWF